jgi:ABC-type multidrug transport system ATPase subunit
MEGIVIKNLTKSYKEELYKDFNLSIEKNKVLTVLGESGSGKTTLLNVISSLVKYDGIVEKSGVISYAFQEDRLIPNLTVKENLELFLKDKNTEALLDSVGLKDFKNSYIKDMSAGEKRRVALLRAIYYSSNILLMDEPFINLDLKVKFNVIELIKKEQEKNPRTIVFVTHDIIEASMLSDRIIVLKKGKIVFDEPKNDSAKTLAQKLFNIMTDGAKL